MVILPHLKNPIVWITSATIKLKTHTSVDKQLVNFS